MIQYRTKLLFVVVSHDHLTLVGKGILLKNAGNLAASGADYAFGVRLATIEGLGALSWGNVILCNVLRSRSSELQMPWIFSTRSIDDHVREVCFDDLWPRFHP